MERRRWMKLAGGAGLAALVPGCATLQHAVGKLDPAAVARLGGPGYGIWQHGRFVAGRNVDGQMAAFSMTKSLAALAVVDAVGDGLLELDRPLTDILPEWRNDAGKRRITVRMLVSQTAGFPSGVAALYRGTIADKGRVAVALPLVDPPGEQFRYGPASSEILAEVLRRVLRGRGSNTETYLRGMMGRIGISSPNWRKDGGGRYYLSTGAELTVRELGRLGQTIADLSNGKNAAGLNAGIFRDLSSPRAANPMVAAGIWWNRNAARTGAYSIEPERHLDAVSPPSFWRSACLGSSSDPGWLALVGSGGKRVYVLPSRDLVIARLDRASSWNDAAFLRAAISV